MEPIKKFVIKDYSTQSGCKLDLTIQYRTYGVLSSDRSNAVLIPSFYGGNDTDVQYLFAPGRVLDPEKHFIIAVNMFGNGCSTSPSNINNEYAGTAFPTITIYDNVICQQHLITREFEIPKLRLVTGFSLGAAQAMQWGALFPGMVNALLPICGAAKVAPHNKVFIESAIQVLKQIPDFYHGNYTNPPVDAIDAFGHVYAAWLFSQDFFAQRSYTSLGMSSPEDVVQFTKEYFQKSDANNLIAMANTWTAFDISKNIKFKGDFNKALNAITAKTIIMPCDTDLYFRVSDNAQEVLAMPDASLRPLRSDWGHAAGFGMNANDNDTIDGAIEELLAQKL
jgi:homoserine O-acetyltransferase